MYSSNNRVSKAAQRAPHKGISIPLAVYDHRTPLLALLHEPPASKILDSSRDRRRWHMRYLHQAFGRADFRVCQQGDQDGLRARGQSFRKRKRVPPCAGHEAEHREERLPAGNHERDSLGNERLALPRVDSSYKHDGEIRTHRYLGGDSLEFGKGCLLIYFRHDEGNSAAGTHTVPRRLGQEQRQIACSRPLLVNNGKPHLFFQICCEFAQSHSFLYNPICIGIIHFCWGIS